jgi:hypothetical protein
MVRGLRFETSNAFSKTTDDTTLGRAQGAHLTTEARLPDGRRHIHHGLSGLDMRHRFVANFTYELPRPSNTAGVVGALLAGWQVNGILILQAGTPFTPLIGFDRANSRGTSPASTQRVSVVEPIRYCPCDGVDAPIRYFDPTVFALPPVGTYGDAGRNILIGPGFSNLDMSVGKSTPLPKGMELQLRAEAYNLLNSVNWAQPVSRIFETNGALFASAGLITATSSPARQFQFSVKLSF